MSAGNTISVGLIPSKSIIKESDNYVQQFVPAGSKYFGVMVRVERVLRCYTKSHGFDKTMKYLTQCANRFTKLRQFKDHSEWKRTLAIDMGRFGSSKAVYKSKGTVVSINYLACFPLLFLETAGALKNTKIASQSILALIILLMLLKSSVPLQPDLTVWLWWEANQIFRLLLYHFTRIFILTLVSNVLLFL